MDESSSQLDATDELPVLTAEAIREIEAEAGNARLEDAVAVLIEVVTRIEERSQSLEARLRQQTEAIVDLQRTCESRDDAGSQDAAAAASHSSADAGARERALREQIAALENYIDGRAEHWRTMEAEVDRQMQRIAELERSMGRPADDDEPSAAAERRPAPADTDP